jgi:muconolactone delta-isomerase
MLFLVISTPHPSRPEDVREARLRFREWIKELESRGKVVCSYSRVGRGRIAIFDVASNDELHRLMTEWLNIVPVGFDIYPLASPSAAEELLRG